MADQLEPKTELVSWKIERKVSLKTEKDNNSESILKDIDSRMDFNKYLMIVPEGYKRFKKKKIHYFKREWIKIINGH